MLDCGTIAATGCFHVSDGREGRAVSEPGLWRIVLSDRHQVTPSDEQIGETTGDPRSMGVLRQPPVANLGEAEHPLDHPDAVLDLGKYAGLPPIPATLHLIDHATMAVAFAGEIPGARRMLAHHSLLAAIRLIPINLRLLAVQQLAQYARIVHVGCGRCH